jgi:excisionase family DNA binding protein
VTDTAALPSDHLLSVEELSDFLQVPEATLYQWRCKGTGPRGIKVGKYVRYRRTDVDAWLEARATT